MAVCRRGHYDSERDAGRHCIQCRRENQMRTYYREHGKVFKVSRGLVRIKSEDERQPNGMAK
jgi:hypothetical protein